MESSKVLKRSGALGFSLGAAMTCEFLRDRFTAASPCGIVTLSFPWGPESLPYILPERITGQPLA